MSQSEKHRSYGGLTAIIVLVCVLLFLNFGLAAYSSTISTMLASTDSDSEYSANYIYNEGYNVASETEAEGATLLKNDGILPLAKKTKVTVLGAMSYNTVLGGTGSAGGADDINTIMMDEALSFAGLSVNKTAWKWLEETCGGSRGARSTSDNISDWTGHDTICEFSSSTYENAKSSILQDGYTDYAIVTFGRSGAEGASISVDYDKDGSSLTGTTYLELDDNERALLSFCKENFTHTIVLVNSASPMELGFIDNEDYNVDACVWIGHPGEAGLDGVAEILTGKVNPSGHLVDTYAYDMSTLPGYYNINDNQYANGAGTYYQYEEGIYVGYRWYETADAEGYFDSTEFKNITFKNDNEQTQGTKGKDGGSAKAGGYDNVVQFPFGYGLSYTTFKQEITSYSLNLTAGGSNSITVKVTNTGDTYSGKSVVELYMEAPYGQDADLGYVNRYLEKSKVVLIGFAKTSELEPGDSEEVTITFDTDELASFDNFGKGCYVLEKGTYNFNVQDNAHCWSQTATDSNAVNDSVSATLASTIVYNDANAGARSGNLGDLVAAENSMDDVTAGDGCMYDGYLSRSNFAEGMTSIMTHESDCKTESASAEVVAALQTGAKGSYEYTFSTCLNGKITSVTETLYAYGATQSPAETVTPDGLDVNDESYAQTWGETYYYNADTGDVSDKELAGYTLLQVGDLAGKDFDDPLWDYLMNMVTLEESVFNQGNSGSSSNYYESVGYDHVATCDGPGEAGNGAITDATWWPCAVIIAATWNSDLAYDLGVAYGHQDVYGGIGRALAPAMDIHRTPFGGRNFEYFSEDGFISGIIGDAETAGIQSTGTEVLIKHFALNDNDTNRGGVCTWANEQAIREIFCKPFEMCVKGYDCSNVTYKSDAATSDASFKTLGIMGSLNRIGMSWEHYGMYVTMTRNEWGFRGTMTTDGDGTVNDAFNNSNLWLYGTIGGLLNSNVPINDSTSVAAFGDAGYTTNYGQYLLKTASKYCIYQYANASPQITAVNTTWKIAWIIADVLLGVAIVLVYIFFVHRQLVMPLIKSFGHKKDSGAGDGRNGQDGNLEQ